MDIFQRSIHSNVKQQGDDLFLVTSQLLDLEHSFHVELLVRISDGTIESAKAAMSKTPFKKCLAGVEGFPRLKGLKIGRGIMGQVQAAIGGPKGCAHLVELIQDAIRLIAMLRIGTGLRYWQLERNGKTEEELIEAARQSLEGSCLVFAKPCDPS